VGPSWQKQGQGFQFNQHLIRRGRSLQTTATYAIFLTIGNVYYAPLNARKIDKHVYPAAPDRDNILEIDPIYLYHSSKR